MKKIIGAILAVVAIAMVGFGIYFMNSGKYIFKTALSGVFDYLVDGYVELTEEIADTEEFEKFQLTTENKLEVSGMEFANINGEMFVDSTNEEFYINLDSSLAGESFLGAEALLKDNVMYAKLKEAMDNFFFIELENADIKDAFIVESTNDNEEVSEIDFSKIFELKEDEIERLSNHLENSILKEASNKEIKKSSETIKVDGKDVKTTKVSLTITDKKMNEIMINFLDAISNDSDSIKILQKIDKNITKKSIQETIDKMKKEKNLSDKDGVILSFYVQGFNTLTRIEFEQYSSDSNAKADLIFIDKIKNDNKQETIIFSSNSDGLISSIKVEYLTENSAKIEFKSGSEVVFTGAFETTDNIFELEIEMKEPSIKLELKETVVKENKKYILEFNLTEKSSSLGFSSTNTLIVDEEMPEIDVDGATNFEEMTEEDYEEINKYIEEKLSALGLFETPDDDNCLDYNCITFGDE